MANVIDFSANVHMTAGLGNEEFSGETCIIGGTR